MRLTIPVAITALCASLASGQSSTEPNQDRVLNFAHAEETQQIQEIVTLIRFVADLQQVSVDEAQRAVRVHGTPDQIGLAGWLFNEFDRPLNEQRPESQSSAALEYRMSGSGDAVVRVFYLPYAKTVQELQEVVTAVRSLTEIRRMFTYNAPRGVAARGTADQIAAAAWLFNELGNPPNQDRGALEYRMPGGNDDIFRVFYLPQTKTVQDFQEVATLVRSIADIRRLFTYNNVRAVALRGTAGQVTLAAWLVKELDRSTASAGSDEYRMAGGDDVVRVFYLPQAVAAQDFQRMAVAVRTSTNIRRAFTYNAPRALALRGTASQIALAAELIAERTKSN